MGRNLLSLPGAVRGFLWAQECHRQLRLSLHGERNCVSLRSDRLRAGGGQSIRLPRGHPPAPRRDLGGVHFLPSATSFPPRATQENKGGAPRYRRYTASLWNKPDGDGRKALDPV